MSRKRGRIAGAHPRARSRVLPRGESARLVPRREDEGLARRSRAGLYRSSVPGAVSFPVRVGQVVLPSPVMTAAGTSGHGAELSAYFPLADLGAVVVKSLSAEPWAGNPAPRVAPVRGGMINSVGLANPGIGHWIDRDYPELVATRARVVVSIWGFTIEQFAAVAGILAAAIRAGRVSPCAVEVNVSCPNIEDRRHMFAHSTDGTHSVVASVRSALGPDVALWAKLSPNVTSLVDIAQAATEAGADALTLVNTVMGLALDSGGQPRLGAGGGGLSGAAIHHVAVRAVADVRAALPDVGIVGVGGVVDVDRGLELLDAGADAIQVGTATFANPRAAWKINRGVCRALRRRSAR